MSSRLKFLEQSDFMYESIEMSSISLLYWFVACYFYFKSFLLLLLLFIRRTAGLMLLPPSPIIRKAGTNRLYLVPFKVPALQNIGNKD